MRQGSIDEGSFGNYRMLSAKIGDSSMELVPGVGCNLTGLTLGGRSVLRGHTTTEDLTRCAKSRSDLLIPFPNRIAGGVYHFDGREYRLDANETSRGNAIHGLVRDRSFTFVKGDVDERAVTLTFTRRIASVDFPGYPFDLGIEVVVTLAEHSLEITVTASNPGVVHLPYGVGWHPYLTTGRPIDRCILHVPADSMMELERNRELIPTGRLIPNEFGAEPRPLGEQRFDTCFTGMRSHVCALDGIELFMDDTMNYCQLYTPDDRESVAIEPMSCAPDAFNNGLGLIVLAPGETRSHRFGIRIGR